MPTVAVLEPAPLLVPLLARTLPPSLAALSLSAWESAPAWQSAPARETAPAWEAAPALVVLGPDMTDVPLPPCRILLTPGPLRGCAAPSVVSYGPSPRDTLTFSSLRAGGMVLDLQREIVTLAGRRVERQELALPVRGEPLLTLAWAGTLLLAGAEPETLPSLARRAF